MTIGRNTITWAEKDNISVHEGIHYLQQVKYGTLPFYWYSYKGYGIMYGWENTYRTIGSMEYEADSYAGLKHPSSGDVDHWGY